MKVKAKPACIILTSGVGVQDINRLLRPGSTPITAF
jgi:hypothetical protein